MSVDFTYLLNPAYVCRFSKHICTETHTEVMVLVSTEISQVHHSKKPHILLFPAQFFNSVKNLGKVLIYRFCDENK